MNFSERVGPEGNEQWYTASASWINQNVERYGTLHTR